MDMIPHSSSNGKRGLAAFAALILTCVLLIGTLSTVQAAPPSAFTRISTNAGDNTSLSMSADGTVITFAEPAQIVVSKNGGALVSASSGLNNTAFPYSPASGSWLAYFATGVFPNSGIFKYSVSGGTKAIVITSNLQSKAAIDNNGNVIAYQTTSDGRYYINGTFTGITATPETNGTKPVCDATGTYVAFRANSTTYVFATANPTVVLYSKAATVGTNDDVPSIVLASVGGSLNWLTCQTSNDSSIKRFKLEDGTGAADFTGANEPAALSADGKFLAAKSSSSNNILIFDAVTRVVVGTIAGLPNPTEIAIANGGGKVSFVTTAKLVAGDTGTNKDVYVWNNVAPIASNQSVSTYEDNTSIPFTLEVSHLVSEGQALTYTVGTYPSKGTLSIALNNYVQIGSTPPSMTYIPFADATGADSFTYTVTDPLGGSSTATVSINIIPLNDAPTIAPIADTSTRFDTPISVDVTVNDIDSPINSLVVTATSSNQAIVKDSNIVASGTGTARSLTITPELTAPSGDVTITVTVTDDVGAFASTQFKLTVISQQPDASVRPSTTPDFIGDGIINLTGTGQTVGLTVATSVATTYYVMVKNTGSNADTFVITGPAAPAGWTAVYKDSLGAVITNAVTHAGWTTAALASGETTTIEVIVTPGATREGGTMAELAITATSVTSPTQQDVVKVQTTVASTFLTDLSLRTSISAVYSGIDIYNLDGTGQTVGLNVSKNSLVSYFVHVQNKGNAPDTFNITATPIPAGWTVVYKVNNSTGLDITADVTSSGWTTTDGSSWCISDDCSLHRSGFHGSR